ncbi:uncharacterized protein TRIADDRAFT_62042 [Trichoplax adhaerens]|uniref:Uncharacterized protein n=1 Tax=Trichoplax adhaerens TaxID=10228 RepID=B3SCN8_TRIAD|nr:hypothetical protein TRIADDRAFT_62042 [Trichoplax adhaerens]EDV19506.1 hypothetical protein TRIADDRAFT_62042 [Trichoplax adhaerens]|eukprot:XP_002118023.1 hypothetical protein TRIADDRAFT_62042 [Trichoplax adhaerens]
MNLKILLFIRACSSQMSEEIADVEFKARIAALKFMIQKLESEHNVLNGKHQTLHEQNDRLKASFDELRQQFEIVKNEKQQLQHSYDSIQLKERQLADDVIRIKQEKENVQTDYRELYAENNHLKDIYRQLNENYKQLKANYESLQVSYNDLKRHNERLKESSHELEERYDRAKLNLEFAKKQMQTNYINEQSKVDAHTIRQLEDEYNALNSSYGKLKKDFDNLDITAAKVAQRCEMLEQLRLTAYEEIKHLKQHEKVLMERNHKLMQRTLDRKELYMEEHHTYKEAIDKLNRHKEDLEQKLQQFQLDKNKKWDRKIRTLLKSIVKGRKNNDSDGSQMTDGPRRPRREYKASEFATDVESDGGTDESSPRPHRHGRNGSRSLPNTPPSTPKSGSRNNSPTPRRRSRSINRYQNEDQVTPVKRSKSPSSAFKPYRNEKKSEMSPYRQKSSDAHRPSTQNTPHGRSVTPRTRPQPYQERVVSDRDYDSDRRYPNQSNLMVRNGDYRIGERPVSPNREKSRRLSPTRLQLEIATAESSGSLNSSPSQEINLSNPQSKSPNNSAGLQRVPTFDNLQLGVLPVNQTPGVTESNDLSDSTYPNKDINDETTLKPFNYRDYNRSDSASDINSMPKEEELKLEKYLLESDTSQSQYREKSPRRSRIIHRPQPAVIHNGSLVAHPSSNASSPSYGPSQKGRLKPVMRDNTVRRPSVEGMQAASNTPTPNNHPNRQIGSQAKVPSVSSQSIHQPNYNVGSSYESATLPRNFKAAPIASYGPMKPNTNNRSDDTYESSTLPRNFSFEKHPPGDYSSNNYYPPSQQALNSPRNVNYSINKSTGYDRSPHSTATSEASRRGSKHPSKDTTSVNSPRGNYNEGTPSRSPRNYSNQAPLARPDDTKRVSIQVKRSVKR